MDQLRTFGGHAPVAVSIADKDSVLEVVFLHVEHPEAHGIIMLLDGPEVAETGIKHVGHRNESPRPGHVVGIIAPVGRGDIRKRTILQLAVFKVLQPLGIEAMVVKNKTLAITTCSAVASPAHALVSLGTIGRHTTVIAPDTPSCIVINGVDNLVGSLEAARHRHLIVENYACEIFYFRFNTQSRNLHIAKAVVGKLRPPTQCIHMTLLPIIMDNEPVRNLSITKIVHIERTVGIEYLTKTKHNGIARMWLTGYRLQHPHHILPHVKYPFIALWEECNGHQILLYLNIGIGLRREKRHRVGSLVFVGQAATPLKTDNRIFASHTVTRIINILLIHVLPIIVYHNILPIVVVVVGSRKIVHIYKIIKLITILVVVVWMRPPPQVKTVV